MIQILLSARSFFFHCFDSSLPFCVVFLLVASFWSGTAFCAFANEGKIKQSLQEHEARIQKEKGQIQRLAKKERVLAEDLKTVNNRVRNLERKLAVQERALRVTEKDARALTKEYSMLQAGREKEEKHLAALVHLLWPVFVERQVGGFVKNNDMAIEIDASSAEKLVETWEVSERHFVWLSTLYEAIDTQRNRVHKDVQKQERLLAKQKKVLAQKKQQVAELEKTKDSLLRDKLRQTRQLADVQNKRQTAESAIQDVVKTIQSLNYKLNMSGKTAGGKLQKGKVPWPAGGEVVQRYSLKKKPPVRGVGLKLASHAPVRAVATGKVVHNDVLRGFGRVVILLHGSGYYTLYAFLEDSQGEVGDTIQQGALVGRAGFYPAIDSSGLYFELRYHQKAVNPELWLTTRS